MSKKTKSDSITEKMGRALLNYVTGTHLPKRIDPSSALFEKNAKGEVVLVAKRHRSQTRKSQEHFEWVHDEPSPSRGRPR